MITDDVEEVKVGSRKVLKGFQSSDVANLSDDRSRWKEIEDDSTPYCGPFEVPNTRIPPFLAQVDREPTDLVRGS